MEYKFDIKTHENSHVPEGISATKKQTYFDFKNRIVFKCLSCKVMTYDIRLVSWNETHVMSYATMVSFLHGIHFVMTQRELFNVSATDQLQLQD